MTGRVMVRPGVLATTIDVGRTVAEPWSPLADELDLAVAAFLAGSQDFVPPLPDSGARLHVIDTDARLLDDELARFLDALRLLDLHGADDLVSVSQLALDVVSGPPDADPEDVAATLAALEQVLGDTGLTAAERAAAVRAVFDGVPTAVQVAVGRADPARFGNLDGVPVELRYAVNRQRLRARLDELDELVARGVADDRLTQQAAELRRLLEEPYEHFGPDLARGESRPRQVLFFDPDGDGRIAEVFGDLDSATQLATFVPGITNRLDNFRNTELNALNIYRQLASPDAATIAWLGYDTPEISDATSDLPARRQADQLADFVNATHALLADGARTTVVGHSYGSLLTGVALADHGLVADAIALIGSPGTGTWHVSQLDLPPGTVLYAGRADGDLVGLTGSHGTDPANPLFGAEVFNTDGISGHSSYTQPNSESLRNLGRIVSGDVDAITHDGLDRGDFVYPLTELPGIGRIKDVLGDLGDAVVVGGDIAEVTAEVWDRASDAAVELGQQATDRLDGFVDSAVEAGDRVLDDLSRAGSFVRDGVSDLAGDAIDAITPDIDWTPW